jgi:hypothetical protein
LRWPAGLDSIHIKEKSMKYGAFIERTPPLARRPGYYTMARRGFPQNPLQPVPVILSGNAVDHRPYPSREHPDLPMATTPPVNCPPGMAWSPFDRACKVVGPTAQFNGLGAYLSPDLGKKWEWDSFAVGIGAAAATMTLGIAASLIIQGSHKKGRDPKIDMSLLPSLIPGMGAGIIAYLLRWNMNNCPCNGGEDPAARAMLPERAYTTTPGEPCPEGTFMTSRGCEELI